MPYIKLTDQSQLPIYSDSQNKVSLNIEFLERQHERLSLKTNSKKMDWKMNIAVGSG